MKRWSDDEKYALSEMRRRLDNDIAQTSPFPEVIGDRRLLRFYNGNGNSIDKAVSSYRKFLKWRKENNIDRIRQSIVYGKSNSPMKFPNAERIKALTEISIDENSIINETEVSLDANNNTAGTNPTEESKKKLRFLTKEEYRLFVIYCLEYRQLVLEQLSSKLEKINDEERLSKPTSNKNVPTGVIIRFSRNIKGIKLGNFGSYGRSLVLSSHKVGLRSYPDTLEKTIEDLTSPGLFENAWTNIRAFLDTAPIEKNVMQSVDIMASLDNITLENLPLSMREKLASEFSKDFFMFDRSKNGPLYYTGAPLAEDMGENDAFDFLPAPIPVLTTRYWRTQTFEDAKLKLEAMHQIYAHEIENQSEDVKEDDFGYVPIPDSNIDGVPTKDNFIYKPKKRQLPAPVARAVVIIREKSGLLIGPEDPTFIILITFVMACLTIGFIVFPKIVLLFFPKSVLVETINPNGICLPDFKNQRCE